MPLPIDDHGRAGDLQSVALVGDDASVSWLSLLRIGSGACFAILQG